MRGGTASASWCSCKWKIYKARAASHGHASLCDSALGHRTTGLVDTLVHPTIRIEPPPLLLIAETLIDSSHSSSRDTKGWHGLLLMAAQVFVVLGSTHLSNGLRVPWGCADARLGARRRLGQLSAPATRDAPIASPVYSPNAGNTTPLPLPLPPPPSPAHLASHGIQVTC